MYILEWRREEKSTRSGEAEAQGSGGPASKALAATEKRRSDSSSSSSRKKTTQHTRTHEHTPEQQRRRRLLLPLGEPGVSQESHLGLCAQTGQARKMKES